MTCPTCKQACVATLTSSLQIGRRRIEWTECANCYRAHEKSTPAATPATMASMPGGTTLSPARDHRSPRQAPAERERGISLFGDGQ